MYGLWSGYILCAVFILLAKIIRQEVQDSEKKW